MCANIVHRYWQVVEAKIVGQLAGRSVPSFGNSKESKNLELYALSSTPGKGIGRTIIAYYRFALA